MLSLRRARLVSYVVSPQEVCVDAYPKDLIDALTKIGQFALLLIAAVWAYFRLWREGVLRPRVDFRIDCKFFGPHGDEYVVEFLLYANNRGLVIQRFPSIHLRVRSIPTGSALELWEKYKPRLLFPEKLFEAEVVLEKDGYIFVEPGVEQIISYVTKVPRRARFVIARAEFRYENSDPHSAERVFEVPHEDKQG
jgi:hypothetical protein